MAEGTTELFLRPQDGWVAAVTGPAVHVILRAPRELLGVAVGASAPSLNDTLASANLSYSGRPVGSVKASGTYTFSDDAGAGHKVANNDTVTVGTRVYTFKTTLTGAANEILIGATNTTAAANLVAAINGAAGAGTTYGTGTVTNAQVEASAATRVVTVTALLAGTAGNAIATTTVVTLTAAAWGAATLGSGVAGETITLSGTVYTFAVALSKSSAHVAGAVAGEVLKGSNAATDYDNLAAAVNGSGTAGTTYGTGTTAHPGSITATNDGVDDIVFAATPNSNGVAVSETLSNASFDGAATSLSGGAPAPRGMQFGNLTLDGDETIRFDDVQGNVYVRALQTGARNWTNSPVRVVVIVTGM